MTKDEMKDKTKRVARFSRNYTKKFREVVDILNGILDSIKTEDELLDSLTLKSSKESIGFNEKTASEAAEIMGISLSDFNKFVNGDFLRIQYTDVTLSVGLIRHGDNKEVLFGSYNSLSGHEGDLRLSDGLWILEFAEV